MTRKIILGIVAALIIVISVMSIKKPVAQTAISETIAQSPTNSTTQQVDSSQNGSSSTTNQEQVAVPPITPSTQTPPAPASPNYTTQSVALHNSASSCYTIVNGNVYDMTNWISQHPGGRGAIKAMCGIDASAMFNNQHGGQGGPERILASYKLGALN